MKKLICFIFLIAPVVYADGYRSPPKQMQSQDQTQIQTQQNNHTQSTANNITTETAAAASASQSQGNEQNIEFNSQYEASAPDVILIPNNNTERCLRVFGLSFSNQSGGGGIGIPWRSAQCDFEAAADDAFAAGERELGWFWKCHNKNLYKPFRENRKESVESAITNCYTKMVGNVTNLRTIHTLEERLTEIMELRESELSEYKESRERLTEMCNEAKDRIVAGCEQIK